MAVFIVITSLILLSAFCFMARTIPSLERDSSWQLFFWWTELVVTLIFLVEYMIRFWATPSTKCEFVCSPINIVDALAILPFFVIIIVHALHGPIEQGGAIDHVVSLLRAFRIIRIFRSLKHSQEIKFILEAVARSQEFFVILFFLLLTLTLIFSSLVWTFERGKWDEKKGCFVRPGESHFSACSPFDSVPQSSWWGIVTLSTVGYGEAFPLGLAGRVVGGFTMMGGILAVALPTAVLGVEFLQHFREKREEKHLRKVHQSLQKCSKDDLVLFTKLVQLDKIGSKLNDHLKFMKILRLAYKDQQSPSAKHNLDSNFLEGSMSVHLVDLKLNFDNLKRFSQVAGLQNEDVV